MMHGQPSLSPIRPWASRSCPRSITWGATEMPPASSWTRTIRARSAILRSMRKSVAVSLGRVGLILDVRQPVAPVGLDRKLMTSLCLPEQLHVCHAMGPRPSRGPDIARYLSRRSRAKSLCRRPSPPPSGQGATHEPLAYELARDTVLVHLRLCPGAAGHPRAARARGTDVVSRRASGRRAMPTLAVLRGIADANEVPRVMDRACLEPLPADARLQSTNVLPPPTRPSGYAPRLGGSLG